MTRQSEQLLLSLRPRPAITFESFVVDAHNAATLHALRAWLQLPQGGVFFIAGPSGSGRSHVLQAASTLVDGAVYLPLAELQSFDAHALLEGLEQAPLLCLDDIDAVTGQSTWCEALFHCFNRQIYHRQDDAAPMTAATKWLVSAQVPAMQLHCALPDLRSRLSWGGSFRLAPLDDAGRQRMLQLHAQQRGMTISDELASYILQRHSRDASALLALLERIDRESLRDKQRVTIALVRKLLEDSAR